MEASERTAAVFFVGNRLMLDDGVGPAAYDEILAGYDIPENVTLVDVGCMSLDMLPYVERYDVILTVDAVDGTGDAPGTVYRFEPDAMARHFGPEASLHDLKLVDLFDAASLMATRPRASAWVCRWATPPRSSLSWASPPNAPLRCLC